MKRGLSWELNTWPLFLFSLFQNCSIYQEFWESLIVVIRIHRKSAKWKKKQSISLTELLEPEICSYIIQSPRMWYNMKHFPSILFQNPFCRTGRNAVLICIYLTGIWFLLESYLCNFVNLTLTFFSQIFSVGSSVCFGKTSDFNSLSTHCWLWPSKSREPEAGFQYWKLQCVSC